MHNDDDDDDCALVSSKYDEGSKKREGIRKRINNGMHMRMMCCAFVAAAFVSLARCDHKYCVLCRMTAHTDNWHFTTSTMRAN